MEGRNVPPLMVAEDIRGRVPDIRLGWMTYGATPLQDCPAVWQAVEEVLPALRARLEAVPLADMPNLGEARRGYKACGKDPGRWRVSSEALYRRVRQGKDLYRINSVVDVNNLVSLETGFSLGSYDLGCLRGGLVFRRGMAGEAYAGIGKDAVDLADMPLLADEAGPVGSPTSDSTRAMIRPESRRILTVIYSFSPRPALESALALAVRRFTALAGAQGMAFGIIG